MDDSFVNLGQEVILTLLWQSRASESATVCFVISFIICYRLFKCGVLRVLCVCACERGRETGSHNSGVSGLNRGLCANTNKHRYGVCHATPFPFRAWTDGKTKDINRLYIYFESSSSKIVIMERDVTFPMRGVRPITMHCVSWPNRADCACRKEGLCRKQHVWERWGIEDLQ